MPELAEGHRFDRYRVQRRLGSGIAGVSYEAEDIVLRRKVTLKLLHPWSALADAARRQFFRDMQVISALSHPYLAPILDYGEIDGQLYIAHRFVNTGSLLSTEGRALFRPPFELSDALVYTNQLAQALAFVHSHGTFHGSLTLTNILVLHGPRSSETDDDPSADRAPFLLTDIGNASFVRRFGKPQLTLLPITAAPEQWHGFTSAASDQYALAVLFYFWLAGRPPFLGPPDEIAERKAQERFPLLSMFNSQINLEQEGILRRALSADPADRYPSILAFSHALIKANTRPAVVSVAPAAGSSASVEAAAAPVSLVPAADEALHVEDEDDVQDTAQRIPAVVPSAANVSAPVVSETEQNPPTPPPVEPTPRIEPEGPQPRPGEAPLPQPDPEPQPVPPPAPDPVPETPPEVLPPGPDIAQPVPEPPAPPETPAPPQATAVQERETGDLAAHATPPLLASFQITSGYTKSQRLVTLDRDETTLGRAGSSDILLDEDTLTSRHHALLRREGAQYVIYDQRSMYGVTVNGSKLMDEVGHPLADGDVVGIGEYELTFHCRPHQEDAALHPPEHALS